MSGETAFEVGEAAGRRFKESCLSQLDAICSRLGVSTASLSTGDYGSGTGSYSRGMGAGRGAGRPGSRHLGGGETYRSAEKPYTGQHPLSEDQALATPTAKDPGAAKEGDASATTRDPANAAAMSAAEAATRDPSQAASSAKPAAVAKGGSPYLAKQREPLFAELDKDPETKAMLGGLLHRENDRDPAGVLEFMANRALAEKVRKLILKAR